MIFPELEEFKAIANGEKDGRRYGRITIYREVAGDTFTPIALLRNFSNEKHIFLLESANLDKSFSRYSFFGRKPKRTVLFRKGKIVEEKNGKKTEIMMNPMDYLGKEFAGNEGYNDGHFGDFAGGFVGFFGYESANYMGFLRSRLKEPEDENLIGFFEAEEFYVFDNHLGRLYAACSVNPGDNPEEAYEKGINRTAKMAGEVHGMNFDMHESKLTDPEPEYTPDEYMGYVNKLKGDITDGEAIQVVFSNKHEVHGKVNPVNFYRALRNVNPSPYMFFLKFGDEVLCGSSPEIHLKILERKATLKPIAGTYPINGNPEKACQDLLKDPKELAEHLMLLDLARNDLYAGCTPESVEVTQEFQAEVYSHVVHIVSTVEGELVEGNEPLDVFMKTFPAGTVSGAPKVRAMELINEYEKSPRGFYAGCVGYFGYSGNIDTCITIRSAMIKKDKLILRAGGGIVYDSSPEGELAEVRNKLNALFTACDRLKNLEGKNVFAG
ncbi:anthranilate synthase component I family protein [Limisalsivibrio acetivorans]|uniref:anthranilate synthase component I family protein n=1 Tax=Limisalsivibrio acetivorans TaxID=1304888 RepID=UPI0003B514A5|nr:chorismate-binding protein [Limisalsivibrio acetivorans]